MFKRFTNLSGYAVFCLQSNHNSCLGKRAKLES